MALRRRGERGASLIWPGFVDAMTALLLVLMFVLSIFMIVQYVLREELSGKDRSLAQLSVELGVLTEQLTAAEDRSEFFQAELQDLNQLLRDEQDRTQQLTDDLQASRDEGEALSAELAGKIAELAALSTAFDESATRADELSALADALRAERDETAASLAELQERTQDIQTVQAENAEILQQNADLQARLSAAEAEAQESRVEAEQNLAAAEAAREEASANLTLAEERAARIAEIRARLAAREEAASTAELTLQERIAALELALDQKRAEAEETLTLLAAAEAKRAELSDEAVAAAEAMSQRERANLFARAALQSEREIAAEERAAVALLNTQVRELRRQISGLEAQLAAAEALDEENQVVIEDLGRRLNQALAQKVNELQRYRSEFFGKLREVLGQRQDIRVVGDRFVFQSEVLFDQGSADLGDAGREELRAFAGVMREIASQIPQEVNWILRVDGHTDRVPLARGGRYKDNWELSQARALSVVEFLTAEEGLPPNRLAAAGFGEHQPIDPADDPAAWARNRRIELKLTER